MYNNPYGKLRAFFVEHIFKNTYLKNKHDPQLIFAGSTCGLEKKYSICNLSADFWVSTYLFLMSGKLVNQLNRKISLNKEVLTSLVELETKKFKFDSSVSKNMQEHLQEWLYPEKDINYAWYKANETSDEIKLKKVKTILNEKYISAFCQTKGGKIIDINPKKLFFRIFNKSYCN